MAKEQDNDPGYGNGAPEAVARYFQGRGTPNARALAEHLITWLWINGYAVLRHDEETATTDKGDVPSKSSKE